MTKLTVMQRLSETYEAVLASPQGDTWKFRDADQAKDYVHNLHYYNGFTERDYWVDRDLVGCCRHGEAG